MKFSIGAIFLFSVMLLGGCSAEPYARAPLPVLADSNPQTVREHFSRSTPYRFTTEDAVTIQAPVIETRAILGVAEVNRRVGTFEFVGLTQTGLEVFHFAGNHEGVTIRSAIPPLMEHKNILLALAQDIKRIYLDPLPSPAADAEITQTSAIFTRNSSPGVLVYELGDNPPVLVDKHLEGCLGPIWRVRYFDYTIADGTLYPRTIVLDNYQYHYRIVVKNRTRAADDK